MNTNYHQIKIHINKPFLIIVVILLLISLVMTLFVITSFNEQKKLFNEGIYTTGVVKDKAYFDRRHSEGYYIKYEFKLETNFYFMSGWSKISLKDYEQLEIGSTISIKYLEDNPKINNPIYEKSYAYTSTLLSTYTFYFLTSIPILLLVCGFISDYIKLLKIKSRNIKIKKRKKSKYYSGTYLSFEVIKLEKDQLL